ncbi:hypothetical protein cyc_07320 [Cyclospora cayetanensis]|uniref:C3H1-type domain-containing protein n=1 Tax=Cyclospora cayetanensis TaxID=88456 RepID=A0A1D3CTP5_9EIME|nr:hypothetical protein cyc_07320 [Cyclospora cayetanensis]
MGVLEQPSGQTSRHCVPIHARKSGLREIVLQELSMVLYGPRVSAVLTPVEEERQWGRGLEEGFRWVDWLLCSIWSGSSSYNAAPDCDFLLQNAKMGPQGPAGILSGVHISEVASAPLDKGLCESGTEANTDTKNEQENADSQRSAGSKTDFKAAPCSRFMRGRCHAGSNCKYAHSAAELRPLPPDEAWPLPLGLKGNKESGHNIGSSQRTGARSGRHDAAKRDAGGRGAPPVIDVRRTPGPQEGGGPPLPLNPPSQSRGGALAPPYSAGLPIFGECLSIGGPRGPPWFCIS